MRFSSFIALTITLFAVSCQQAQVFVQNRDKNAQREPLPADSSTKFRLFLLGDAGMPDTTGNDPVLKLARKFAFEAGNKGFTIFLGDNIYPKGLPDSTDPGFSTAFATLKRQIDTFRDSPGKVIYMAGNHDWANGGPQGLDNRRRIERWVDSLGKHKIHFLPSNGFPGPFDLEIDSENTLIFFDTQWWLHPYEKPTGSDGENVINEPGQVLVLYEDLLLKNAKRNVITLGHHPLYSNGAHGGFFSPKTHVFPFTLIHPALLFPLPLAGSFYPMGVRFIGGVQDLAHPKYKQLRKGIIRSAQHHERLVYASGHDHSLQYIPVQETGYKTIHQVTSGSASKSEYVAPGERAAFTSRAPGFMEIRILKNGAVWLIAWGAQNDPNRAVVLYRKEILAPMPALENRVKTQEIVASAPIYADSTITRSINPKYWKGKGLSTILGSGYRQLWSTPVTFPYLDIGTEQGGMIPLKRGGGMQTVNIRMKDASGKQWALRSIDKDATISIPWYLKQTAAVDALQDQISSLNPYGALVIPDLSIAAGIRYTKPRLFYVPDDERFGVYRTNTAGTIMMLEERPDDLHASAAQFGKADEVVGADKLYENITEENDDLVDQYAFAKARFFDVLIGDWDRHRNQWSWAKYKSKKNGTIYRPIPRDRDFAFFKFEGPIPFLVSKFDPKFANFDAKIKNLEGLTKNGLDQDRRFMNALTKKDWLKIADSLIKSLPDSVIREAIKALPDSIESLSGEALFNKLQARKKALPKAVEKWYLMNNKVVEITGSNKHERIDIDFFTDDSTSITVHKTGKDGDIRRLLYKRTFYSKETREIRIFGLDGNDRFYITGKPGTKMEVRLIGGSGPDTFFLEEDRNYAKVLSVFDTRSNTAFKGKGLVSRRLSNNPLVNEYRGTGYQHDSKSGLAFFDYNIDDGVFVGGGMKIVQHDFRQYPFGREHILKANMASRTLGYNFMYKGHYRNALDPFDVLLDATWLAPTSILNFYGFGNDTKPEADAGFYQAQLEQIRINPALYKMDQKGNEFKLGPMLHVIQVNNELSGFLGSGDNSVDKFDLFKNQIFIGMHFLSTFHNLTNWVNPKSGFRYTSGVDLNSSIRNKETRYFRLFGDLAVYTSPSLSPQVTIATRIGGSHNVGDFPFYHANSIGGTTNLRGFRSSRFTGRSTAYVNNEVRFRMFDIQNYGTVGEMGGILFVDAGRVWAYSNDTSRTIHMGYGGGLWFNLLDLFVLSATTGFSEEGTFVNAKLGFQF